MVYTPVAASAYRRGRVNTAEIQIRQLTPGDAALYRSIRLEGLKESPEAFGSTFEAGPPQPLFDMPLNSNLRWPYQPAADGQRFLVLSNSRSAIPPVTVVLNWQAGIKR